MRTATVSLDEIGALLKERQARVIEAMEDLNIDELEVLAEIAESLVAGVEVYGHLDIETDGRDFAQEATNEFRDAALYLYMRGLQRRRKGGES